MKYNTAIASHGVKQSADAGNTSIRAVDEAHAEHQTENGGSSPALCCLENELNDGHAGWSRQDGIGVDKAEEHNEDKGKATKVDLLTKPR